MHTSFALALAGALAGLSIVVPIGPMGLLCIQRSLRFGFRAGFATGLGGVTTNVAYAAILLTGLRAAVPVLQGSEQVLGTLGGLFLLWSGLRVLRARTRLDPPGPAPVVALPWRSAYVSGLGFNAANPMSLVLMLAALGPLVDDAALHPAGSAALLAGLAAAASGWWACLSTVVSALRTRIRPDILVRANRLAGVLLSLYGSAALLRAWTT